MKVIRYLLVIAALAAAGCAGLKVATLPPGDEDARARLEAEQIGPIPNGTLLVVH